MDSHRRSIAKTISYRVIATIFTALIAWAVTGQISLGLQIGALDAGIKLLGYFAHERLWTRIKYGLPKPPDYEI